MPSHQLFGSLLPVSVEDPKLSGVPVMLMDFYCEGAFSDPLAQVTKGKQRIDFFTIPEYEQWNGCQMRTVTSGT